MKSEISIKTTNQFGIGVGMASKVLHPNFYFLFHLANIHEKLLALNIDVFKCQSKL